MPSSLSLTLVLKSKKEIVMDDVAQEPVADTPTDAFANFHEGLVAYINNKITDAGGKLPLSPVFNSLNNIYFSLLYNAKDCENKVQTVLQQFVYIAEALIRAEANAKAQPTVEQPVIDQPLPEITQ